MMEKSLIRLWAANNKLDSYIFPIDGSTSFTGYVGFERIALSK